MPETVTGWGAAAWAAVGAALVNILGWLPRLLGALIILLVGWGIAVLVGNLVDRALEAIHFDRWMSRARLDEAIARTGMKLEPSDLMAALVKWGVFLVAILVAADALGLPQVTAALNGVIAYIPNVIAAILIVTFGALLATFLANVVRTAPLPQGQLMGDVAYWAVLVFAGLAALAQLNIAPAMIQTLFTAVVGAVALAAAIAFGLGLQKQAEDLGVRVGLKQILQAGDSVRIQGIEDQTLEGQIVEIGAGMTTVRTTDGTVLIPNWMLAEHLTTITATGPAAAPARVNVTRLEDTPKEAPRRPPTV